MSGSFKNSGASAIRRTRRASKFQTLPKPSIALLSRSRGRIDQGMRGNDRHSRTLAASLLLLFPVISLAAVVVEKEDVIRKSNDEAIAISTRVGLLPSRPLIEASYERRTNRRSYSILRHKTEPFSLLNCYNSLAVGSFPSINEIRIFLAIAGSVGNFPIQILMNVNENKSIVATSTCGISSMDYPANLMVTAKIRFSNPGVYAFEVYCDGAFLLQKPLTVFA
jgi:hypothetical protein